MFGNGHWIIIRTLASLSVVCTLPRQNRILCTYWSETENSRYIMNLQSFTFFFWNQFFLCMKVPILIINNRDILTCTTMSTFWTVNVCILPLSSQPYRSMWWTTSRVSWRWDGNHHLCEGQRSCNNNLSPRQEQLYWEMSMFEKRYLSKRKNQIFLFYNNCSQSNSIIMT